MSGSKTIAFVLYLATLLAFCNANANANANVANQPLFPAILIFGDSTVDTGNNDYNSQTAVKANHLPYGVDFSGRQSTGRFSNGKLIPDILASKFNIKNFIPPFLQPNLSDEELITGVCFATAGSGYDDYTSLLSRSIPVSQQIIMFKNYIQRLKTIVGEEKSMEIINNALVIISAGPNDFILNYYDIPTRRLQYPQISDYQDFVLNNLNNFVTELYSLGCRKMVVGGLPPIGCLPIQMTAKFRVSRSCLKQENMDSVLYNQKLQNLLPQIQASLTGSKFLYSNVYDPTMDMIQNPSKYGFKETQKGCCGTGYLETIFLCNPYTPTCPNHSEYVFWDSIHPSEATYNYVANITYTKILQELVN